MRYIAGDAGDIPRFKIYRIAVELHGAAVGMAQPDFETVMEMKPTARDIGNSPMLPAEDENRKVYRQIIVAAFQYRRF